MTDMPADAEMLARYERAARIEQATFTKSLARNDTVHPVWIDGADAFWYRRDLPGGRWQFRLVDAAARTNRPAFDHAALAGALSEALSRPMCPQTLPLKQLAIDTGRRGVTFQLSGKRWRFDPGSSRLECLADATPAWRVSPAGKTAVFLKDHNLWVRTLSTGADRQLTFDGERRFAYAGPATVYGRTEAPCFEVLWSPDGARLLTYVIDTRDVGPGPAIVEYVPTDGSARPKLIDADRRVALPGDDPIEARRFLSICVETGESVWADAPPSPVASPPYVGFFSAFQGWWSKDGRRAYYLDQPPGGKIGRLREFDTQTGQVRTLIEDRADQGVTLTPVDHLCPLVVPIHETNELIWYSRRSGHAHFYLHDLDTGQLRRAITQGPWLVRNILHVDPRGRDVWIQTAGRHAEKNPYYTDICRIDVDTGDLTEVVNTDHTYFCADGRSRISCSYDFPDRRARAVSPSGDYVVATRSRVDMPPTTVLFDRDGTPVMTVEDADVSSLPDGWIWPEPVMVKAADGQTDLYGVVFRPSDFSPDRTYPIIDASYAYSAPIGSFSNSPAGERLYYAAAALAELGFIVVMVNGRGTEDLRDEAFNRYADPERPVAGKVAATNKADCVSAIKQLGARFRYMDLDRVGVVEFGSVPAAIAGLFLFPDVYKVGVSNNPICDTRVMASFGYPHSGQAQLDSYADRLDGRLLLIAGMMDDVAPVAGAFRVVDALIRADKRFDMLFMPNAGHELNGYMIARTWDYLVEHLAGRTPPKFALKSGFELFLEAQSQQL